MKVICLYISVLDYYEINFTVINVFCCSRSKYKHLKANNYRTLVALICQLPDNYGINSTGLNLVTVKCANTFNYEEAKLACV